MMKVMDLRPRTDNIDITLKVLDVKIIHKAPRVAESLVGDETGMIVLKTIGIDQTKRVREATMVRLRNAKIEMFKGSMRLMVKKAVDIEPAPDA
ncbi:DNA-binding related protein, partial [Trifolium medium]|nr:DNA-binding related protein [Trifolium medium]